MRRRRLFSRRSNNTKPSLPAVTRHGPAQGHTAHRSCMFLIRPESEHSDGADGGMAPRSYHDRRGVLHEAQSHFARCLDHQITILAGLIAEHASIAATGERRRLRAISLLCEMVGALVLSRSIAQAAPAFSNELFGERSARHHREAFKVTQQAVSAAIVDRRPRTYAPQFQPHE